MKTRTMWFKRAAMLLAMAGCALLVHGESQRKWEPEITASDTEFWRLSKTGRELFAPIAKDAAGGEDVATNVRAVQGDRNVDGRELVYINYDAVTKGSPVNVSVTARDDSAGIPIDVITFMPGSDVGLRVPAGKNKLIRWDVGTDYKNHYSEKIKVNVIAIVADNPETWATVTISWAAFGGTDLDVCGYWLDRPDVKVGWSYGTGSTSSTYRSTWRGDNTGSGPEYINIGVVPGETLEGVVNRKYRVHCNYYGSAGSSSKATISASCNGVTKSKTISVSNRHGSKAKTSDPCVTISFSDTGALLSVD